MMQAKTKNAPIRVETIERTPIHHTIAIEVDASRVRKAFDRAYRDLAKQVRIKGFRPGKAPRSVLEKLHGASVAEQLEHRLVSETLADAIDLSQPASAPSREQNRGYGFEQDLEILGERPRVDVLEVELYPVVEVDLVSSVDLPQTGDSRAHRDPPTLEGGVPVHLSG